ncbi:hypothetical protein [Psychromonas antarctica]|uniref:hypothetical protein n=1 Tax=Psychromonas antarctica TaxID=67573 RepID=UPI001EE8E229|nr:hypothetical protein [Psychromonas antarctica]MCG6201579.1 hypothetical protein [Psychromonas antarctica]
MSDIHELNSLPSQAAIDSIAIYRLEFDKDTLNYPQLLSSLKKACHELNFMSKQNNKRWMREKGHDYLNNPTLFDQTPLTYLCVFLGEIFKTYDLPELQEKLTPQILKCALTRLQVFRLH